MATHSSVLAWRIPWKGEPDGLPSVGSHRVGLDWGDLAAAAAADSILKKRGITLSTKVRLVKAMFFSSSHVWIWELDYKESWAPKNWCLWTVVFENTLQSPSDCKEIQPAQPKGDQSWVFIGRTDVKAETPIVCPSDAKSWLTWKDPYAGKDWGQVEMGTTEDEMVGWHHRLNGCEFG